MESFHLIIHKGNWIINHLIFADIILIFVNGKERTINILIFGNCKEITINITEESFKEWNY